MNPIELVENQIQRGNEILNDISGMRERPSSYMNVIAYKEDDIQNNRKSVSAWQYFTVDVLTSIYGDNDDHVKNFKDTITSKDKGFNYQREFRDEVNSGLSILEAIRESIRMGIVLKGKTNETMIKPSKIFISHKTEDRLFVEELVSLIESIIGTDPSRLFCSSIGGYDIKPGKEILSELKRQFEEYKVIFIVVHSPRYYTSSICLNEMGAAWVLGAFFFSFLTPDCKYNMLNGVIDGRYMSIKVNDSMDMVVSKMNSFKDYLLDFFSIDKNNFNHTRWEKNRNEFIDKTSSIEIDKSKSSPEEDKTVRAMANISAELVSKNPYVITVINRGDGEARNLELKLDDKCDGMLFSGLDHFPLEYLKTGRYVNLTLYPCLGDPDQFKLFFSWEEKGKKFYSEDLIII